MSPQDRSPQDRPRPRECKTIHEVIELYLPQAKQEVRSTTEYVDEAGLGHQVQQAALQAIAKRGGAA
jgi:hypothetical protein